MVSKTKVQTGIDNSPIGINLNYDQASLLLKSLEKLDEKDKGSITFKNLRDNISMVMTLWNRRIKNAKIVKELNKEQKK